jgi:hypothetical protein
VDLQDYDLNALGIQRHYFSHHFSVRRAMNHLDSQTVDWPTSDKYCAAFKSIRDQMTVNQLIMLQRHYHSAGRIITARRLADLVGFVNWGGVNLQYGTLAKKLCEALEVTIDSDHLFVLVTFARDPSIDDGECQLAMRPQVAQALETLGWVWHL